MPTSSTEPERQIIRGLFGAMREVASRSNGAGGVMDLFTESQWDILQRVERGVLPPAALDALLPESGSPAALQRERLALEVRPGLWVMTAPAEVAICLTALLQVVRERRSDGAAIRDKVPPPARVSPVCRGALLVRLLQVRPWQLPELADQVGASARQLRNDLAAVRAAGWVIDEAVVDLGRGAGRPKIVSIGPGRHFG